MADKYDRIRETLEPLRLELQAEKNDILQASAAWHDKRRELVGRIQPLELELKKIDDKIEAIESPRLREVGNQLAIIARQTGARTLVNNG